MMAWSSGKGLRKSLRGIAWLKGPGDGKIPYCERKHLRVKELKPVRLCTECSGDMGRPSETSGRETGERGKAGSLGM